jgi:hypothetical protein
MVYYVKNTTLKIESLNVKLIIFFYDTFLTLRRTHLSKKKI